MKAKLEEVRTQTPSPLERQIQDVTLRGAAARLKDTQDHETILAGPAETGKTYGALVYLDDLLRRFPGAQAAMVRKVYADLVTGALQTYKRVLGPDSPVRAYGGEKPQWFDYPNGSRLWLAGLDNPGKTLSTERDFIYVNQAEELSLVDWETLTTRVTGRGSVAPFTRLFGDANPGPPTHWILQREGLNLLESRHEDNPALWDGEKWTEQGVRTLAVLDRLTGVRKQRLRYGRWVQAEGVVYEEWDRAIHLQPMREIPEDWPRYWVVDFGYTNPMVVQWWAEDPDGRLYRYRELYETQTLVSDQAKEMLRLSDGEPMPQAIICDHDAEDRATLERALREGITIGERRVSLNRVTTAAHKAVSPGIQAVQARLRVAGDGRPRLVLLEGALVRKDPRLVEARKPTCTEEEMDVYMWPKGADGKPQKEAPVKENDHGCDDVRYIVAYKDVSAKRIIRAA